MVKLLSILFIKNRKEYSNPKVRQKYGILSGVLGIFLNLVLFAIKLTGGILSGSVSMIADAFNNLTDIGSCVVIAFGFSLAEQKPDKEHPYGHGRIEYIAGLIVSLITMIVGVELFHTSITKIITPEDIDFSLVWVILLVLSIGIKGYMAIYNLSISNRIGSEAIRALVRDSIADCVATTAVLTALLLAGFFDINIDGWVSLLVSVFVFYSGLKSAKETMQPLLGAPPDPKLIAEIEEIVLSYPEVAAMHDLIIHEYGPNKKMVSLHAEVPEDSDFLEIHHVVDNIEREITEVTGCQVIIHMDPIAIMDKKTQRVKSDIEGLLYTIDKKITIHDFRLVKGEKNTKVIFDMVVPYESDIPEPELKTRVFDLIKEYDRTLYAVVEIDRESVY